MSERGRGGSASASVSVSASASGSARLFVALPVPDHIRMLGRAAAAPAEAAAPELTWTRPEGWHLTLAFLGDVDVARVGEVEAVVAAAAGGPDAGATDAGATNAGATDAAVTDAGMTGGPIGCRLAGADRFGGRALYLAVADDPAGAIASLGARLQAALDAAGLPVRRQEVRPHLTLARASRRGASITDDVCRAVAPVTGSWEADTVELVRSQLGDGPARYTPVGAWHLGPAPGESAAPA